MVGLTYGSLGPTAQLFSIALLTLLFNLIPFFRPPCRLVNPHWTVISMKMWGNFHPFLFCGPTPVDVER